jgi:hypothetical protein
MALMKPLARASVRCGEKGVTAGSVFTSITVG